MNMRNAILSAVLLGLAVRGWLPGIIACVALVPLILELKGTVRPLRAALLATVANSGILLAAFEGALPVLPWAMPAALLLAAPWAGIPGYVFARLRRRSGTCVALWSLPVTWTASEFLTGRTWLWGQLASPVALGYTQFDSPLLSVASLSGVSGVSLAVLAINVSFAHGVMSKSLLPLFVPALLGLAINSSAAPRQDSGPEPSGGRAPVVALMQPALDMRLYETAARLPEARERILADLMPMTASARGADLIIWPEGAVPPGIDPREIAKLATGLLGPDVDLLAGTVSERDGRRYNSVMHAAHTRADIVFDKLAPVPLGEATLEPGTRFTVGYWGNTLVGPLICLDSLYPAFARQIARAGAELLVVISDDSFAKGMASPTLHLRASAFRAVETGIPLVFASGSGPSAFVSPSGRVTRSTKQGVPDVLISTVPPLASTTHFVLYGDWLGAGCAIVGLLTALAALLGPRPGGAQGTSAEGQSPHDLLIRFT
jgi:apolipoprotein N-acyltransferase